VANLVQYFHERLPQLLDELRECVELESPSSDKQACDQLASWLGMKLVDAGAEVEYIRQSDYGKHVVGRLGSGDGNTLVLGHYDTVWPVGEVNRRPFRIEGNRAFGPGVFDMKIGDIQILAALRALADLGIGTRSRVTVLFNSDEEIGSPSSRRVIEQLAAEADHVLVLEPAEPPASLKTFRKGVGAFHIRAEGVASHAGADPEKGASAIEELARQVLKLHGLTDYERGTTLNVGVIRGGSRSNVVAAEAEADLDLRVTSAVEGERMVDLILGLTPFDSRVQLTVEGGLERPPMERTPGIVALYHRAQKLARELGFDIDEAGSGGGSDGNFTAAWGVPTLDGLGGVGGGGHALSEHIVVDEIPKRTALLTRLLAEL